MSAKDDESGVLCSHRYIGTQQPHKNGTCRVSKEKVPLHRVIPHAACKTVHSETTVLRASNEDRAAALGVLYL